MKKINIPSPEIQVDFTDLLLEIRKKYLHEALSSTIENLDISSIDKELFQFVPNKMLSSLAAKGLRGELLFPVPYLLSKNPYLLGYYRLLLGHSKKLFYSKKYGMSSFQSMEDKGTLSVGNKYLLNELCAELIKCAVELIEGIGMERISIRLLNDLVLLTLGAQLRGGKNVRLGIASKERVFSIIHDIVKDSIENSEINRIAILNAASRKVLIDFAADPDIIIREEMSENTYRNIIAIEVKGGKDFSNIHNRIGEAEKSHQKARKQGFAECWTVVNVDNLDVEYNGLENSDQN